MTRLKSDDARSRKRHLQHALTIVISGLCAVATAQDAAAATRLTVVIVRHGEKPDDGDNLTCKGLNRALQLPKVIRKKFGRPDFTYVPSLKLGPSTKHARMFQTVAPLAVQQDLKVNSEFDEDDVTGVAADVLGRSGVVLMVWEHTQIHPLAQALGVAAPPDWDKRDFDSIWIITPTGGAATLRTGNEGLSPSDKCP